MIRLTDKPLYDKKDTDTYILLLSAPVLLSIYYYFGYAKFFTATFSGLESNPLGDYYSHILQFIAFCFLTLVLPSLYLVFSKKRSFKDIGMGLGDTKFGFRLLLILVPLIIPIMYFASAGADIQAEYPLAKILLTRKDLVWSYEIAYVLFYYVSWEFYFRGFLLFGLRDRFGDLNAILIQTISSCLVHLGKPAGETIGAIIVGVIFGIIALRTRSIWYVFVLHILIGVLTDLYIIYFHHII